MRVHTGGLLAVVAGVVGWVLASATPAAAHAVLLGTSPPANTVVAEPPDEVMLVFNQPVFTAAGAVTVLDADDRSVHAGTAQRVSDDQAVRLRLHAGLPDGIYTVRYRVTASDGHVIEGRYQFGVGGATLTGASDLDGGKSPELPVAVVLRWLLFSGIAVAAGGQVADRLIRPYAADAPAPAPPVWVSQGTAAGLAASIGLVVHLAGVGSPARNATLAPCEVRQAPTQSPAITK